MTTIGVDKETMYHFSLLVREVDSRSLDLDVLVQDLINQDGYINHSITYTENRQANLIFLTDGLVSRSEEFIQFLMNRNCLNSFKICIREMNENRYQWNPFALYVCDHSGTAPSWSFGVTDEHPIPNNSVLDALLGREIYLKNETELGSLPQNKNVKVTESMPLENVCEKKADLEFLGYTKLRRLRNQSGLSKKTRRKRQEMVNSSICQPTDLQSKQSVVTHCFDRHRFDNCDVPFIPQQTDVGSSSLPLATVFWDFENINVGRKDIVHFICSFKLFLQTNGYLLESFNAIGNLSQAPALRLILEHLALVDVKNQNKQAADDHIISHMEFFTRAIVTPKEQHTIFLVSGDSDFIPIVKEMKLRGYKVNIVYRSTIAASSKLLNRADQLFKFSEIMRFGGLRF